MSVVSLQRLTLIGAQPDCAEIIEQLQALGCVHIDGLKHQPGQSGGANPAQQALKYLMDNPMRRYQETEPPAMSYQELVEKVLANREQLRDLREQIQFVEDRISNIQPWGDFELPDLAELGNRRFWFYQVPRYKLDQVRASELLWSVVAQDGRFAYVVVLSESEPDPRLMPVARTHMGELSLSALRAQREQLSRRLDHCQVARYNFTRYMSWLARHMAQAADKHERDAAATTCYALGEMFLLTGWVDQRLSSELHAFAERSHCVLVLEPVAAHQQPPTLLENPPLLAGGEDLVAFYQMPAYRSWDPSQLLFFSFASFFAMILADAGYALVLAAMLGISWSRMGRSEAGQRLRMLFAAILLASLLFGVLCGSYFGIAPTIEPFASLNILTIDNYDQMIALTLIIGCAHLILANGISFWRGRGRAQAYCHLGWIFAIAGTLGLWLIEPDLLTRFWRHPMGWLMLAGLVTVVWFSAPLPVSNFSSLGKRLLQGMMGLADITKLFGDALSYLRLFALGLASASLALTCNQLAADLLNSFPDFGIVLAALVWVGGHMLNLVLGVVSGVVHGLRLNFIEFYHWSLSDEGYPFTPFKKQEIVTWNH